MSQGEEVAWGRTFQTQEWPMQGLQGGWVHRWEVWGRARKTVGAGAEQVVGRGGDKVRQGMQGAGFLQLVQA